ncbi:MAG: Fic family protein [Deltaproteobacteria bacterium]|jgi:cell filamentation protein|nr:Fic family protein [Deltaproteobacteria bacterium]
MLDAPVKPQARECAGGQEPLMPYWPLAVDRDNLTLMGVSFPDLKSLEMIAEAIDSCMFEGFRPSGREIEIVRDCCLGKITLARLASGLMDGNVSDAGGMGGPDFPYVDPATGVLRNAMGISDRGSLAFAEYVVCARRLCELAEKPVSVRDSSGILAVHRHLFQDIYAWSGEPRTVDICKGNTSFLSVTHFRFAFRHIDDLLTDLWKVDGADREAIARMLGKILAAVNYLHPFREGNGRTQREFLRLIALERRWSLNLHRNEDADAFDRYMKGTVNDDEDVLASLIYERLTVMSN